MATKRKLWEGIITDEDYYALTSRMSPERKANFDEGFKHNDANFLMSLGGTGFHIKRNKWLEEQGEKVEKNFKPWWDM